MKKILLLLLFAIFSYAKAQTHRFVYRLDINKKDFSQKFDMVLDIDPNNVKFYDAYFLKIDSLNKKTGVNTQTNTLTDQLILRKRNSFDNTEFHDNNFDYLAIKSHDQMDWKILKDTKMSDEFKLQKATTNFGGRTWTAWFSPEIPFQEGPYKFRGLPGLIFEISDNENIFNYHLIKSTNLPETFSTIDFLETHFGNKPIEITRKQYHKMKLDEYNDPMANMKQVLKHGGTVNISGEKITTLDQLDQKKKFTQEMLVKYYFPVDKEKAIPYPQKK